MRVAIAGFSMESASLVPVLATIEDFEAQAIRGEALISQRRGTSTVIGGFIKVCQAEAVEIVPLVATSGGAAGSASDAAFDQYVAEICDGLRALQGRIDGVLLDIHGAMVTETRLDPDADIMRAVRDTVGPELPVIGGLDYHGNLDHDILTSATALFGYHKSPHTDMAETGERAARCMVATLRGHIKPLCRISKPMVMVPSIASSTVLTKIASIQAEARRTEAETAGYLDISVFAGFSYADVPNCGFTVVAVTDNDAALGERVVQRFADMIYAARQELYHPLQVYALRNGVERAIEKGRSASRPVVLLEHADRMNDSTYGLRELLRQGATSAAVPYLWDPQAAAEVVRQGKGARVQLEVGGFTSAQAGGPVILEGIVRFAGDKQYRVTGPMGHGRLLSLGPTAVIDAGGIVVTITSNPVTAIDADPFTQFGMRAKDFDVILLRSKTHFRAVYESLAEEIIIIDTPDWGPYDLTSLPYKHVNRAEVYPFVDARPRY